MSEKCDNMKKILIEYNPLEEDIILEILRDNSITYKMIENAKN